MVFRFLMLKVFRIVVLLRRVVRCQNDEQVTDLVLVVQIWFLLNGGLATTDSFRKSSRMRCSIVKIRNSEWFLTLQSTLLNFNQYSPHWYFNQPFPANSSSVHFCKYVLSLNFHSTEMLVVKSSVLQSTRRINAVLLNW